MGDNSIISLTPTTFKKLTLLLLLYAMFSQHMALHSFLFFIALSNIHHNVLSNPFSVIYLHEFIRFYFLFSLFLLSSIFPVGVWFSLPSFLCSRNFSCCFLSLRISLLVVPILLLCYSHVLSTVFLVFIGGTIFLSLINSLHPPFSIYVLEISTSSFWLYY